ncbi:unnamed protein product [Angiostrongylus costaricensis]|uniref:Uncharacterized protein n=1 Tax=Angiostrongylus costaricensis TaxID=334426 RepID=A0A0R3PXX2_ANGCS|nr:unnamed protein product [Angiostrongylus costaricensis]
MIINRQSLPTIIALHKEALTSELPHWCGAPLDSSRYDHEDSHGKKEDLWTVDSDESGFEKYKDIVASTE